MVLVLVLVLLFPNHYLCTISVILFHCNLNHYLYNIHAKFNGVLECNFVTLEELLKHYPCSIPAIFTPVCNVNIVTLQVLCNIPAIFNCVCNIISLLLDHYVYNIPAIFTRLMQ